MSQQPHQLVESLSLSAPPSAEAFDSLTVTDYWDNSMPTGTFHQALDLAQGSDYGLQNPDPLRIQTLQHEMQITHTIPDLFTFRQSDTQLDQGQFFDLLDIPRLYSSNCG